MTTSPSGIYTDAQGNKVVQPVFHGETAVGGVIGIKR